MAPSLPPPNPHVQSIISPQITFHRSFTRCRSPRRMKKPKMLLPPPLPMPTPDELEVTDILCSLPVLVRARDPRRIGCAAYLVPGEIHWLAQRCRSLSPLSDPAERLRICKRGRDNTKRVLVTTLAEEKIGPASATATEAAEHNQPQNLLLQRHQAPALEPAQTFIALQQQSREVCEAASREARKERDNPLREKRAKKSRN